jgi:hypothetical protein
MNIRVARRKVIGRIALATAALSAFGIMVEIVSGHHDTDGWLVLFDLDKEWNVPTIYAALLFFAASGLVAMIAAERRRIRAWGYRHWIALAAIFFELGADELFSIHNSTKRLVPDSFMQIGLLKLRWDLRWVVVGIIVTFVIVIAFVPFVARLPRRTACGMVTAGMMFVGGALGVEMIGGAWIGKHTKDNWTYSTLLVLEETLEMVSIVIFLDVLLAYSERELGGRARLGSFVLEIETPQRSLTRLETQS